MASGTPSNWRRPAEWRQSLAAASHRVVEIDLRQFGGSALTGEMPVPKKATADGDRRRDPDHLRAGPQHDFSVVRPGLCRSASARSDIFIGVNALDYSGYPDCRPEYIAAFERMANLATKAAVEGRQSLQDPYAADSTDEGRDHSPRPRAGGRLLAHRSCYDPDADGLRLRPLRFVPVAAERLCRELRPRSDSLRRLLLDRRERMIGALGVGRRQHPSSRAPIRSLGRLDRGAAVIAHMIARSGQCGGGRLDLRSRRIDACLRQVGPVGRSQRLLGLRRLRLRPWLRSGSRRWATRRHGGNHARPQLGQHVASRRHGRVEAQCFLQMARGFGLEPLLLEQVRQVVMGDCRRVEHRQLLICFLIAAGIDKRGRQVVAILGIIGLQFDRLAKGIQRFVELPLAAIAKPHVVEDEAVGRMGGGRLAIDIDRFLPFALPVIKPGQSDQRAEVVRRDAEGLAVLAFRLGKAAVVLQQTGRADINFGADLLGKPVQSQRIVFGARPLASSSNRR